GWAGAVALAIIATPVIVRTTEDMLRLVPNGLRSARRRCGRTRPQAAAGAATVEEVPRVEEVMGRLNGP
ncbi:MAG TPA: hypothetical protein VEA41_08260, partial [Salinarimonas sp.]|nr:hypothetical protein [Salinarimonas sp.]